MSTSLAASASRQTLVLAAITGLHLGAFILISLGLRIPQLRLSSLPEPVYVFPKPLDPVKQVEPEVVRAGDYTLGVEPEPKLNIPHFGDPAKTSTAAHDAVGGETGNGPALPAPTEIAPKPRIRDSRLAALINACYPASARRLGEEGRVVVRLIIDQGGRPASWAVEHRSGFPRLDSAADCVIRRLEFAPGRRDGRAVEAVVLLPISFRLD